MSKYRWSALFLTLGLLLAACDSGDAGSPEAEGEEVEGEEVEGEEAEGEEAEGEEAGTLTLWTALDSAGRVATQEQAVAAFTEETGIEVEVVGVHQNDMPETMISAAAAGDLPDVILHAVDRSAGWVAEGLLDADAATEVISDLDPSTFSEGALQLVSLPEGDKFAAVPTDGWGQLIFYRADVFEDAGLDPPDTYEAITEAAQTLHGQDGLIGIVAGNASGDNFAMQTFEHFSLANGCHLVDDAGELALDTEPCVHTIEWWADLMTSASAGGEQDTDSSRATYLSGNAAMVSWSPHLIDELVGMDPDNPVTCDECIDDPQWLFDRTDVVALVEGPDAAGPAQFGQTINLGISTDAAEGSSELATYLLSDGYMDFLQASPEARFPTRQGTPENPTQYVEEWRDLIVGEGEDEDSVPVGEIYDQATLDTIIAGATEFDRWASGTDKSELLTTMYGDLELTRILREVIDGSLDAATAAAEMQQVAEDLNAELETRD